MQENKEVILMEDKVLEILNNKNLETLQEIIDAIKFRETFSSIDCFRFVHVDFDSGTSPLSDLGNDCLGVQCNFQFMRFKLTSFIEAIKRCDSLKKILIDELIVKEK